MNSIDVRGLTKRYGEAAAVAGVSFTVEDGEIFGLLGPNGAGKTTTLEIIEGLRKPDGGQVLVMGLDVTKDIDRIKERIGVQLQTPTPIIGLRVEETIKLFASFYGRGTNLVQLLKNFGLYDARRMPVRYLSGGQQQRLSVALALVHNPELVILDEPTTGFDPQARRSLWSLIRELRSSGKTILFSTHYMEEAEALCDRVAIMDQGRLLAIDAPRNLIRDLPFISAVECELLGEPDPDDLSSLGGVQGVRRWNGSYRVETNDPTATIAGLVQFAQERNCGISNISVRTATLEDVFVQLTGTRLMEDATT